MTEDHDLTSDRPQEGDAAEQAQDQAAAQVEDTGYDEPTDDDPPELRLQAFTAQYARERAVLAEQISQLQEENDWLQQRVRELEQSSASPLANVAPVTRGHNHPEYAIGLDFSVPEGEQG